MPNDLKITNVETVLLRVPLRQRTITDSQSKVDDVEFLQVRIHTDAGVTGYGMNWSYTTGLRAAQVMIDENYISVIKNENPLFRKEIVRKMFFTNHFVGRVGAARVGIAAVEFALWDIACKLAGMPLWKYLGACRDKVKAYSTDGGWLTWSADELIHDATGLVDRGFDAVKIKLGRPDPREDYQRIAAVRKAVGPNINIMTDVNCAWSLATARYWGAKLADHDIYWLEEPMMPEDVKSHAQLAAAIRVPIAVGETIYTKQAFRDYIETGACAIVQADATKLLGIGEWLEVAALANAYTLPIVPHTNVQQKLHVQLAAATPHAIMVENCYESINEIWEEPIYVKNGYYNLPEQPGVGLRLRDAVIAEHRIG
ncbi:MAG: mandelate racemase/muconate lactonizing enzyme family protein [Planctomycetes bacterium]|nr:mandelate racemase/muconate lactonizing enzyme family protein [Planctomycetota bacterium]